MAVSIPPAARSPQPAALPSGPAFLPFPAASLFSLPPAWSAFSSRLRRPGGRGGDTGHHRDRGVPEDAGHAPADPLGPCMARGSTMRTGDISRDTYVSCVKCFQG